MKKQKTTDKGTRFLIIALVVAILIIAAMIALFVFRGSHLYEGTDENQNTIEVYADENFSDANNLKTIHLANIYVVNGGLYEEILDDSREVELGLLTKTLEEIRKKETLPLTIEHELGLIQAIEISNNDSNYIYAVADYLPFKTEVTYTLYIPRGVLSGGNCSKIYDEIDTDLQNANYCTVDSDCKTLPLAGPYIEFGCYHYINKNENSALFYNRMNEYSAECGNIIDLCRISPEPKCAEGKCIEAQ